MKKLTLVLLTLICTSLTFCQEKISDYTISLLEKKCDVLITLDSNSYTLWVEAHTLDEITEKCGLMIDYDQIDNFRDCLDSAISKYKEWRQIAVSNNVKDFDKDIKTPFCQVGGYFDYFGKWHFDYYVTVKFKFTVTEISGITRYMLIINTSAYHSLTDNYTESKGALIVITTVAEAEKLRSAVSASTVEKYKKAIKTKESLFKD